MSDIKVKLTEKDRDFIFMNVTMLSKAFVELAAYTSNLDKDIQDQKDDICELASMVCSSVAKTLDYDEIEAIEFTKKAYAMQEESRHAEKVLKSLDVDNLGTDA
jgi:hypothetical protein|tara:strand:- start:44 stop:355 length:312 start_codon:yes stop_codon:yes gene_type:complete